MSNKSVPISYRASIQIRLNNVADYYEYFRSNSTSLTKRFTCEKVNRGIQSDFLFAVDQRITLNSKIRKKMFSVYRSDLISQLRLKIRIPLDMKQYNVINTATKLC